MINVLSILYLVFLSDSSNASIISGEKSFCRPLIILKKQVSICVENLTYAVSADHCYNEYEKIASRIANETFMSKTNQEQNFYLKENSIDLAKNLTKLEHLSLINNKLQKELKIYTSNFIKPVDDRHLMQTKCYADPFKKISTQIKKLQEDENKFQLAIQQISKNKRLSDANYNILQSTEKTSTSIINNYDNRAIIQKNKNLPVSDITGTVEKK